MKEIIDIIIVTHVPSSYKVNLYNEMAKTKKIFVIFISLNSTGRTPDFINRDFDFEYEILNYKGFEERFKPWSIYKLIRILFLRKYNHIIVNGWDMIEFWISIILPTRSLKGVAIESSIYETNLSFIPRSIKKFFLSFVDFALPSGTPHSKILNELNFNKPYKVVGGVGIPNVFVNKLKINDSNKGDTFLFLGRLVNEKNLNFLILCFNELPNFNLHIVGSGPLERSLKAIASSNIRFTPHISNNELPALFKDIICLILPSSSEPWGLVVEESVIFHKPVLVSSKVGSNIDFVENNKVGLVFDSGSKASFIEKIIELDNPDFLNNLIENCKNLNQTEIYNNQISAYNLEWLRINNV